MIPDARVQVKAIVQEALDRAPDTRAAFVTEACQGDRDLRREVESLLAAHEREVTFVDSPLSSSAAARIVSELVASSHKLQRGDRLGPYEVVGPLGAGGVSAFERRLGGDASLITNQGASAILSPNGRVLAFVA